MVTFATILSKPLRKDNTVFFNHDCGRTIICIHFNRDNYSITTLNMYLRGLKTFFFWAQESKLIAEVPRVKKLQNGRGFPRYLSNEEFDRVQAQAIPFLADVFWFYRETGCRLREPFNAVLKGSFRLVTNLNVPPPRRPFLTLKPIIILISPSVLGLLRDRRDLNPRPPA